MGPVFVSVIVPLVGYGTDVVMAMVEVMTDVMTVTLVLGLSVVVDWRGMYELLGPVELLLAVEVKDGIEDPGAVPVPQVDEAVPVLFP